jgi:uncharacterized RDD family membrane protein YckC
MEPITDIQNIFPRPLPLASQGKRFAAYMIDILPIVLLVALIAWQFFGFEETTTAYLNRGEDIGPRREFLFQRNIIRYVSFAVWILLCIWFDASSRQGSFGKQLMKIKVVGQNGERLSLAQSAKRNLAKSVSRVLYIGFVWMFWDKKKQTLHDKFAGTYVVDASAPQE